MTSPQSQGCPQPRSKYSITQYYSISKSAIQNVRYCRIFAEAGLKLSQYMVATQESINSRFCSVVEIKLSFFLKGGHLPRSGSTRPLDLLVAFRNFYYNINLMATVTFPKT